MTVAQFDETVQGLNDECRAIVDAKRPSYTVGSEDVLANFKSVAERLGLSPMQVWAVYFLKHIDSITAIARDRNIPQGEPILGRFADAKNYLDLGWGLLTELDTTLDRLAEFDRELLISGKRRMKSIEGKTI